jgi:hypothetical protein
VLEHGRPCVALREGLPDQRACRFEMLAAPLADSDGRINMLIAALVPARSTTPSASTDRSV